MLLREIRAKLRRGGKKPAVSTGSRCRSWSGRNPAYARLLFTVNRPHATYGVGAPPNTLHLVYRTARRDTRDMPRPRRRTSAVRLLPATDVPARVRARERETMPRPAPRAAGPPVGSRRRRLRAEAALAQAQGAVEELSSTPRISPRRVALSLATIDMSLVSRRIWAPAGKVLATKPVSSSVSGRDADTARSAARMERERPSRCAASEHWKASMVKKPMRPIARLTTKLEANLPSPLISSAGLRDAGFEGELIRRALGAASATSPQEAGKRLNSWTLRSSILYTQDDLRYRSPAFFAHRASPMHSGVDRRVKV